MNFSVRLHGDRTKARAMAEAHVSRLMREFRRLNEFQNLKQNARRIDLYDGDFLSGYILLRTVFGVETVEVYAAPVKPVEKPKVPETRSWVCPVLKGRAEGYYVGPTYYAGPYGGHFVFLDGYLSENVLFIPQEFEDGWTDTTPAAPLDTLHNEYKITSLSLLGYDRSPYAGAVIRLGADYTGIFPNNIMYVEEDPYPPLTGAPQGWINTADDYANQVENFAGAIWGSELWCGAFDVVSMPGTGNADYEKRFRFQTPGRSWEKSLVSYGIGSWGISPTAGRSLGGSRTEYSRGDALYSLDWGKMRTSETTEDDFIWLVSASFEDNEDVQQMLLSDLPALASAEMKVTGEVLTVRPTIGFHDWCLVTEEV